MPTHVVLIRHAATNAGGRLCGSYDVPLSKFGREQVEALLDQAPTRPAPDVLLTSTLRRARDVASVLATTWNLNPLSASWAREIDCGHVDGMLLEHVRRDYPVVWARNELQVDDAFAWPGGETYAEFRRRIVAGLCATASTYAGSRVAVVTHAGVIAQVLGLLRNRPAAVWSADRPAPFTATEVLWQGDEPTAVLSFNDPDWY